MAPRIALIVDNPLRDLDGLILVAWHLARAGADAYLVPMYDQPFDIPALHPDVVLANYVRANNIDLLKEYRRMGIRIAVLDTEGNAGKSPDEYARMVAATQCGDFVDAYLLWGEKQYEAFTRSRAAGNSDMRLTGCPRFDFCAPRWRGALRKPSVEQKFVLINTNFPVVHPRFSASTEDERRTMTRVGFTAQFATEYARASTVAYETMVSACARLAGEMRHRHFVLRPHPFESPTAYEQLAVLPNFEIRQEGTSLEWINGSSALLHQNCSTAVEAVMLGREPIALEWFNHPALRLEWASSVSRQALSFEHLLVELDKVLVGQPDPVSRAVETSRAQVVRDYFFSNDGRAGERVAESLLELALSPKRTLQVPSGTARARVIAAARRLLGPQRFRVLQKRLSGEAMAVRRTAKAFSLDNASDTLARIGCVEHGDKRIKVDIATDLAYRRPRLSSGRCLAVHSV